MIATKNIAPIHRSNVIGFNGSFFFFGGSSDHPDDQIEFSGVIGGNVLGVSETFWGDMISLSVSCFHFAAESISVKSDDLLDSSVIMAKKYSL